MPNLHRVPRLDLDLLYVAGEGRVAYLYRMRAGRDFKGARGGTDPAALAVDEYLAPRIHCELQPTGRLRGSARGCGGDDDRLGSLLLDFRRRLFFRYRRRLLLHDRSRLGRLDLGRYG